MLALQALQINFSVLPLFLYLRADLTALHEPKNQPRSPPVSARGLPPLALHASYSFKTQPQFPCRSSPVFSLHPSPLLLSGAGGQHLDGATSPRTLV